MESRNASIQQLTLVLDLDKTLVYVDVPEEYNYGEAVAPYAVKRPGLESFMAAMAEAYGTILVVSAAPKEYVKEIVSKIVDPTGSIVAQTFCADDMKWWQSPGSINKIKVKDVTKLGRDLNRLVWLDDTPGLYPDAPFNGVAAPPFKGDPSDKVLEKITPLLVELSKAPDVAKATRRKQCGFFITGI